MHNEIQYPVSIQPGQPGLFHRILTGDELGAKGPSETSMFNPLAYRSSTLRPEMENGLPCAIVREQERTQVSCAQSRSQVHLAPIGSDALSSFWAFKEKERVRGSPNSHRAKLGNRSEFVKETT